MLTAISGVTDGDGEKVGAGAGAGISVGVDNGEIAMALRVSVTNGLAGRVGLGAANSLDARVANGLPLRVGVAVGLTVRDGVGSGPGSTAHAASVVQSRMTRVGNLFILGRIGSV